MKFRDIISKSILVFLLCQHAVNATSQWSSKVQALEKRWREVMGVSAADTERDLKVMTIKLKATLNAMLRERMVGVKMSPEEVEVLRSMKETLERQKVGLERNLMTTSEETLEAKEADIAHMAELEEQIKTMDTTLENDAIFGDLIHQKKHILNNLMAKQKEIQTIAREMPMKMEERKAVYQQLLAADINWLEDFEDAIRTQFLGSAQKELDEDNNELCQHAVNAANQGPSQAKDVDKLKAELKTLGAAAGQKGTEFRMMKRMLDEYVEELETLIMTSRERKMKNMKDVECDLKNLTETSEETVGGKKDDFAHKRRKIVGTTLEEKHAMFDDLMKEKEHDLKLKAKQEEIQIIAKKLIQRVEELKPAVRQYLTAGIDLMELEDASHMKLLRRAQKELDMLLKTNSETKVERE